MAPSLKAIIFAFGVHSKLTRAVSLALPSLDVLTSEDDTNAVPTSDGPTLVAKRSMDSGLIELNSVHFSTQPQTRGLDFTKASVWHSNLGAQGPDVSAEGGLVFGDIFASGWNISLRVEDPLGSYIAHNASRNGINGSYGQINFEDGSQTTLKFTVCDSLSGMPVVLPIFHITLTDIRKSSDNVGWEGIKVSPVAAYYTTLATEMNVVPQDEKTLIVEPGNATVVDINLDADEAMSAEQAARTITFKFQNTSEFTLQVLHAAGAGARNLLFSGHSALVPEPIDPPCDDFTDLDFSTVAHNNLAGFGPDSGDMSKIYSNVAIVNGSAVDLKITASKYFFPAQNSLNASTGKMGAVSIATDSDGGSFTFHFQDHETGLSVNVGRFFFTFFDMHGSNLVSEMMTLEESTFPFDRIYVPEDTELALRRKDEGYAALSLTPLSAEVPPPVDPLLVGEDIEKRGVSFFFDRPTGHFTISFGVGHAGTEKRAFMFAGATKFSCPGDVPQAETPLGETEQPANVSGDVEVESVSTTSDPSSAEEVAVADGSAAANVDLQDDNISTSPDPNSNDVAAVSDGSTAANVSGAVKNISTSSNPISAEAAAVPDNFEEAIEEDESSAGNASDESTEPIDEAAKGDKNFEADEDVSIEDEEEGDMDGHAPIDKGELGEPLVADGGVQEAEANSSISEVDKVASMVDQVSGASVLDDLLDTVVDEGLVDKEKAKQHGWRLKSPEVKDRVRHNMTPVTPAVHKKVEAAQDHAQDKRKPKAQQEHPSAASNAPGKGLPASVSTTAEAIASTVTTTTRTTTTHPPQSNSSEEMENQLQGRRKLRFRKDHSGAAGNDSGTKEVGTAQSAPPGVEKEDNKGKRKLRPNQGAKEPRGTSGSNQPASKHAPDEAVAPEVPPAVQQETMQPAQTVLPWEMQDENSVAYEEPAEQPQAVVTNR